ELAWRFVDNVAMQFKPKTVRMTSVPMLHPLSPGYTPLGPWPMLGPLPGAPTVPTTFALCVWAVYKAQVTLQTVKFAILNVHQQASEEEDAADEGVTWWSRACDTDRETVILLECQNADRLLRYEGWCYTRL
ncbi:MAG: hypothetical protein ACKPKO_56765, partial [Candidatus Fonsibacter sp.]